MEGGTEDPKQASGFGPYVHICTHNSLWEAVKFWLKSQGKMGISIIQFLN